MIIMVIDTSSPECVVGLFDGADGTFIEKRSLSQNNHAELLFSVMDSTLKEFGVDFDEVSHIVAIVGPGSFTGLRASLAAVQGLKLSTNITVHGVSLLELQAYLMLTGNSIPESTNIMSIIEVPRANSVFYQVFNSVLLPLTEVKLMKSEELDEYNDGNVITKHSCELANTTTSMAAAKLLLYKIENNLPATELSPIYARSYV